MKLKCLFSFDELIGLIFKVYFPILLLLIFVKVISSKNLIAIEFFIKDPGSILILQTGTSPINVNNNFVPFMGAISQVGIFFWSISISLCFFCSTIISRKTSASNKLASFLNFFGFITLILLLDDLFMLHESVFPWLLKIPEKLTFLSYGLLIIWGTIKFKTVIIKTEWIILLLSLFWFGGSIIVDLIPFFNYLGGSRLLIEDGLKLFGIISWFYYFLIVCVNSIK